MEDVSARVPVLTPSGDIDLATSRELAAQLSELAGEPHNAVLDLSQVRFMDSIGLGVVLKALTRFERQDKRLVLVVPPGGSIASLMRHAGIDQRFPHADTRER